jgi:hypothetical protein
MALFALGEGGMTFLKGGAVFAVLILELTLVSPLVDVVTPMYYEGVIGAVGGVENDPRFIHSIG